MMPGFATALARNVCTLGSAPLADNLGALVYLHVADTLIAAIGGARRLRIDRITQAIGHGGDPTGLPPASRAFGLALAAHALQADDGDRAAGTHPGCVIIPAVWAAKSADLAGRDLAAAVAIGYQVAANMAAALPATEMKGAWHRTPVAGVFGAAAATAWLIGLRTEDELRNVLCITASLAAGILPSYQSIGAMEGLHPALAAEAGVRAAYLGQAGIVANDQALDGARGYLVALSNAPRLDAVDPALGLGTAYLKRYPCVRAAQEPIDAIIQDATTRNPAEIRAIDLHLSPANLRFSGDFPQTRVDAALNLGYCLALTLEKGGAAPGPADFDPAMRQHIEESGRFAAIRITPSGNDRSTMTIHDAAGTRQVDLAVSEPTSWAALTRKWDGLLAYGDTAQMGLWDLPDTMDRATALSFIEARLQARVDQGLIELVMGE